MSMGSVRIVECCFCGETYATRKDDISQHLKCGKRTKNPALIPDIPEPYNYY